MKKVDKCQTNKAFTGSYKDNSISNIKKGEIFNIIS